MKMELPEQLIGWHGIGETRILKIKERGNEYRVTLDLSTWVDEEGYGESVGGQWVKKQFPTTVILLENPRLDKQDYVWYADRMLVGRGRSRKNRYYAIFAEKPREDVELMATFPHKIREKRLKDGTCLLDVENFTLEEVLRLRAELK